MSNTAGFQNNANGSAALYSNTIGNYNTADGANALTNNTTGEYNTANGNGALLLNISGSQNTANGANTLRANTGSFNTADGVNALYSNTIGEYNTAIGNSALFSNTTGSYNTALGFQAYYAGVYSNSAALGYAAVVPGSNEIVLGNSSIAFLRCQVALSGLSDKRIKDDIKENVPGLDFIIKLRPVTYRFNIHRENEILGIKDENDWDGKYDIEKITMTGFIAQEVEQTAKQIGYDFSGVDKPKTENDLYGLRYSEFVVPLVKAVQEQQQLINDLKLHIDALKKENDTNRSEYNNRLKKLEDHLGKEK